MKQIDINESAPAAIVRNTRVAKGWSQTDLAEEIGCSQSTISRIESGASPIIPELAGVLAQVLGVRRANLRPDIFTDFSGVLADPHSEVVSQ